MNARLANRLCFFFPGLVLDSGIDGCLNHPWITSCGGTLSKIIKRHACTLPEFEVNPRPFDLCYFPLGTSGSCQASPSLNNQVLQLTGDVQCPKALQEVVLLVFARSCDLIAAVLKFKALHGEGARSHGGEATFARGALQGEVMMVMTLSCSIGPHSTFQTTCLAPVVSKL